MIEMKDMDYLTIQTLAQLEARQSQKKYLIIWKVNGLTENL